MSHVEVGYPPARNIVSPLHASIAILGCHPLYVRRLWLGKTTAKVGYGLSYVNTYYGLLDLHFGLIRWDLHEPNFIYQAHHLFPTETLSGLADPPTAAPEWQAKSLGMRSRELLGACPLEGLVRFTSERFWVTSELLRQASLE